MTAIGRLAISGAKGFLGWHLACRMRALDGIEPVLWGREELGSSGWASLDGIDTIVHVAGVNRASTDAEVEDGNVRLAERLAEAVRGADRPLHLVYANSVHASGDGAYGRGKRRAADLLAAALDAVGGSFTDVVLPNLFGEHGRPGYNSFVATFAHAVAGGGSPTVADDREVALLHAQAAAESLRAAAHERSSKQVRPSGTPVLISSVLERFRHYDVLYRHRGEVPALASPLEVAFFNTYRAACFPGMFPVHPQLHVDPRGALVETGRAHGGTGQSFVSTTVPGATRGDHYHLSKVERFFVVRGRARIRLRRLLTDDVVTFDLSGAEPGFVDMPTLWTHNITNIGDDELVTCFWADQLLDPDDPDQFPERVEQAAP